MINKNIKYKTLKDYVEALDDNLRLDTFKFSSMNDALITDVLPQYADTITFEFTDEEIEKYHSEPKKLSYDLYKTTDLWFMICNLNGAKRSIEFKPDRYVKLPSNQALQKMVYAFNNLRTK